MARIDDLNTIYQAVAPGLALEEIDQLELIFAEFSDRDLTIAALILGDDRPLFAADKYYQLSIDNRFRLSIYTVRDIVTNVRNKFTSPDTARIFAQARCSNLVP
jgi:hypothetical protein